MKKLFFMAFLAFSNLVFGQTCAEKMDKPAVASSETEALNLEKTPVESVVEKAEKAAELPKTNSAISSKNYARFDSLLIKNVSAMGRVNYQNLKKEEAEIATIIAEFQADPPQDAWPKNEKLAFWLNAYNLFTLDLVVKNYPLKKITDLDGGKTWDMKRIEIGGKKLSLNDIENEIIRPKFNDPRIHFALNCAAKGCPPLLNRAFSAENVQSLLTQRTKKFVRSKANNLAENAVEVSKIFDWYAKDFGALIDFLNKYSTVKIAPAAKVIFKEYDWSLNE